MLYHAQGHFLATHKKPLFTDKIEAWRSGPVVKNVYDRFEKYGNLAIDFKELENFDNTIYTKEHIDTLAFVYNKYNTQKTIKSMFE